ncbi:putative alpha-amylase [Aspergillus heteromorphus CBS 117.55]|uniref:alpha-amylase n=1 Tax=Aspergillus heteromorphus CBS 117.55 TaxID=1448321 RepID=A0A317VHN4_9EURO|nr:putative alpha-amylase [Aspergillus heteromorphus CBS 117.55]PWY72969.1 putative alpha-amylase [Aspergillus heteromorphus CBS 117.55]
MVSSSLFARWAALASLVGPSLAATTEEWKHRSVYQVMTDRFSRTDGSLTYPCNTTEGLYCGGTWQGLINKLDYIQGMNFDAVMISPVMENIPGRVSYGEAYHGYWPLDLYNLNSHFGTHEDLLDLSAALHNRSMYLLVDMVINNMAYMTYGNDPATTINYTVFTPFNSSTYFHSYCIITNWNNYTDAQLCQTGDDEVALPDLFTEHEVVQDLLESWSKDLVETYSIDGLRIDAAKSVTPSFLPKYVDAVGGWMTGEVMDSRASIVCDYQNNYLPSLPNYPLYYSMLTAFISNNISALLAETQEIKNLCDDPTAMAVFSEDQDIARFASLDDDMALAKNVITFVILFDGVSMIYQGQEQHLKGDGVPSNREAMWLAGYNETSELYLLIKSLNAIRKHAYNLDNTYSDQQSINIYEGSSELAFWKGTYGRQVIMVINNQGSTGGAYSLTLPMTYGAGTAVTEVLTCGNYTVNDNSELIVEMDAGLPRVFFPTAYMEGSGICGYNYSNVSYADLKLKNAGESTSLGVQSSTVPSVLLSLLLSLMVGLFVGSL